MVIAIVLIIIIQVILKKKGSLIKGKKDTAKVGFRQNQSALLTLIQN